MSHNANEGVHQLYMEMVVPGQILHLHRKGLTAKAIAQELGVSTSFTERIIRERFGRKGTITGYDTLAHWKDGWH